jgi:CRISPR system Cascade subunit CasB
MLKLEHPDELMRSFIHAVRLLDRKANVPDLARGLRYWGDNTRQRWAFDYYAAAPRS